MDLENDNNLSVAYAIHIEDELTAVKTESISRLNFNAYTDMDTRERARARDKRIKAMNFVGRKT